jgi:hypothetical protein
LSGPASHVFCICIWLRTRTLDYRLVGQSFVRTFTLPGLENLVRILPLVSRSLKICPNFVSDLKFLEKKCFKGVKNPFYITPVNSLLPLFLKYSHLLSLSVVSCSALPLASLIIKFPPLHKAPRNSAEPVDWYLHGLGTHLQPRHRFLDSVWVCGRIHGNWEK